MDTQRVFQGCIGADFFVHATVRNPVNAGECSPADLMVQNLRASGKPRVLSEVKIGFIAGAVDWSCECNDAPAEKGAQIIVGFQVNSRCSRGIQGF